MFQKILIANRGEIACRIIKTAKRLGIKTVAVYSDADQSSHHVSLADEAIYIGKSPSSQSYLIGQKIIDAALKTGASAIHPGYGFLSENAEFAKLCATNNLTFIGPPANAIESMGSKSAAKNIMQTAEVPLVPGYHGDDQSLNILKTAADKMGYPVLLKAVAGGGGKGMRQVWSSDEFANALTEAKRESMASFSNDDMLVEKYLTQPRHVEVQVFCDQHGNGVYLFERDCSVQRRHQKVIEEAPAPNITLEQRQAMGNAALKAAQAIHYQGAGTVEFLLDVDGSFYFMEMNTRLQVEHPVTEMITGQDLVEWQLKVANGESLPLQQDQLHIHGHAFEARIYAEDPNNDFMPTTGILNTLKTPKESKNIRVDTGVIEGDEVSHYYDPMIAKLIVWGEDRDIALNKMATALREYRVLGLNTNIDFLHSIVTNAAFAKAQLDTGFIENQSDDLFQKPEVDINTALAQASLYLMLNQKQKRINSQSNDIWNDNNAWRMNQANEHRFKVEINQQHYSIKIEDRDTELLIHLNEKTILANAKLDGEALISSLDGHRQTVLISQNAPHEYTIFNQQGHVEFKLVHNNLIQSEQSVSDRHFSAPMNGTLVDVLVRNNETVKEGQTLVILEAMKMQHSMRAPSDGVVDEVFFKKGDLVDGGSQLLSFNEN